MMALLNGNEDCGKLNTNKVCSLSLKNNLKKMLMYV